MIEYFSSDGIDRIMIIGRDASDPNVIRARAPLVIRKYFEMEKNQIKV
jgi:hypothetical protein